MTERGFWSLEQVSDEQLEQGLQALLKAEGQCEARIVAHLAQVDARRIALKRAQSLFEYCQNRLGFSDNQAYYRIAAARVASRYPIVFELLEKRQIHLVNIAPLSKLLTEENHRDLLTQAGRLSKRELLKYLAQRYPRPDAQNQVRKLPPQPGSASFGPTASLEPRSATSYRLQLNTSETLKEKLELARDLMSHANPSGDIAVVVERALDLLIEKLKARRFGQTKHPRRRKATTQQSASSQTSASSATESQVPQPNAAAPSTRRPHLHRSHRSKSKGEQSHAPRPHVAHEIRREIFALDGFGCSYVAPDGNRCKARAFIERDHIDPFGKGGSNTSKNLRHLCASHNRLAAELEYGIEHIQAAISRPRTGT